MPACSIPGAVTGAKRNHAWHSAELHGREHGPGWTKLLLFMLMMQLMVHIQMLQNAQIRGNSILLVIRQLFVLLLVIKGGFFAPKLGALV